MGFGRSRVRFSPRTRKFSLPRTSMGRDPFNQNSNRSAREKWSTSKGGPVFSKLFRLDRTDPLSFGPKFPEILVELIAPHARPGQRKFSCPGRESNPRPSKSHHSRETNRKIMAGILSYEPTFDRKILLRILDMFLPSKRFINSSQSLKRDRRSSFPASKWTKILGTLVCI